MKNTNSRGKTTISMLAATVLAISMLAPTTAFAQTTSGTSASPAPTAATSAPSSSKPTSSAPSSSSSIVTPSSSIPTPPSSIPPTSGGNIYISGYNVVDAQGEEIVNFYQEVKGLAAFTIVDERIEDSKIPAGDDLSKYIHARIVADNFTSVSGGDIRYDRRAPVDGKLSYTVSFNDTTYKGTGKTTFSFDLSTTDALQNSFPNAPIVTLSQNIAQAADKKSVTGSHVKPTIMVKSSSYGAENIKAGEKFTLELISYNTSKVDGVSNVTTTVELPKELTLAGGSNSVLTDTVKAGAAFTNKFELMAQSNAETTVANITVKYSFYVNGSDEPMMASQMITVAVVQPDRFSFSSMQIPPEMFLGEENTISVGYVNKGKGILYNISAEISGNIKNPGQQQFLGNLQPGAEGTADFVVTGDAAGTLSGTITLTYEDINGKSTTQTKEYSVNITENKNGGMMGGGMVNGGGMMYGPDGMPMDPGAEQPKGGFPWWGWLLIVIAVGAAVAAVIVILKKRKAKKLEAMLAEDDE